MRKCADAVQAPFFLTFDFDFENCADVVRHCEKCNAVEQRSSLFVVRYQKW